MFVWSPARLLFAGGQSTSAFTFLSPTSSSYHVTVTKPLPACALGLLFAICLHSWAQGTPACGWEPCGPVGCRKGEGPDACANVLI